jgi:hypothetical protein
LLETIKDQGISTVFIRGRDNKAAFDKVVDRASSIRQALSQEKEVKKALVWAEEEQKRAAERRMQEQAELEEQRRRRVASLQEAGDGIRRELDEIARELAVFEAEEHDLTVQIKQLRSERIPSNFSEWYISRFPFESILGHGIMWTFYGFAWIPAFWLLTKGKLPPADPGLNAKLNDQIKELTRRKGSVEMQIFALRKKSEPLSVRFMSIQQQIKEANQ